MITNSILLEAVLRELEERSLSLEESAKTIGVAHGNLTSALQPLDQEALNRNVRLVAKFLDIPAQQFAGMLKERVATQRE